MQKHTQIYYDYFGLDECDTPECEITGELANDIHHIYPRGMGGRKTFTHDGVTYDINDINNLMALSRVAHVKAESKVYSRDWLWNVHQQYLEDYG